MIISQSGLKPNLLPIIWESGSVKNLKMAETWAHITLALLWAPFTKVLCQAFAYTCSEHVELIGYGFSARFKIIWIYVCICV